MIMKSKLLALFLLFSVFNSAQSFFGGNFSVKPEKFSSKVYDNSIQNIYYQLSFVSNAKATKSVKQVNCVLQIGNAYSKFGELNTIKYDSLTEKYSHTESIGSIEFNQLSPLVAKWKTVLLRDIMSGKIIIQDKAKDTFQYTESQPVFNWKVENEKKEILGYTCQKATVDFRGRKYHAWFSKDIPINSGPYIFNGLPGMILEIEDEKNHYHFTAIGIDKKKSDIYLRNDQTIFEVDRTKFRQVQKSYYENPSFYMNKTYDANGNAINDKMKARPYNPIELE